VGEGECPACLARFSVEETVVGKDAFRSATHLVLREVEVPAPENLVETAREKGLELRLLPLPEPRRFLGLVLPVLVTLLGGMALSMAVALLILEHQTAAMILGWISVMTLVGGFVTLRRALKPVPRKDTVIDASPDLLRLDHGRALVAIDKVEVETHRGGRLADIVVRHRQYRERTVLLARLPRATAYFIARRLRRALRTLRPR
jgi:hypothetical protein